MASQGESRSKHSAVHEEEASKKTDHKSGKEQNGDNVNNLELDSLLSALEGDLTTLDSDTANDLLTEWYNVLHKAKEPEIKEIAGTLKELRQLLKGGKATGHEIGEILVEIGEQTSNVAADADKGVKTQLQKLGKQFKKVGTSLGKAEDQEHIEHIDSLIETIEGDLTSIDSEVAIAGIDQWYTLLHKSEDENLKEIANGLKQLKQILKRSHPKASDIGEVLLKLGEQTQEAAKEAGRGFKGPIQRLGKLLSKTGKSLE